MNLFVIKVPAILSQRLKVIDSVNLQWRTLSQIRVAKLLFELKHCLFLLFSNKGSLFSPTFEVITPPSPPQVSEIAYLFRRYQPVWL